MNFSYSYSGTAGVSILLVSGSVTQTWSAGYSQSWEDTTTESYTATDSTSVTITGKGGRLIELDSKHLVGENIPYEATYTIKDNSVVTLKFEGKSGYIRVYKHVNYTGANQKYNDGTEISKLEGELHDSISSVKVSGGVEGILFQNKNYGGKSMTFTKNTAWVGDDFNDKASSLKVKKRVFQTGIPIVMFAQIKDLLPTPAKEFTAKGTMDIDYTYPVPVTRVMNYTWDEDYVNTSCKPAYSGTIAGASAAASGPASPQSKSYTQAQIQQLLKSGKLKKQNP